jgi:hypothetical protein
MIIEHTMSFEGNTLIVKNFLYFEIFLPSLTVENSRSKREVMGSNPVKTQISRFFVSASKQLFPESDQVNREHVLARKHPQGGYGIERPASQHDHSPRLGVYLKYRIHTLTG